MTLLFILGGLLVISCSPGERQEISGFIEHMEIVDDIVQRLTISTSTSKRKIFKVDTSLDFDVKHLRVHEERREPVKLLLSNSSGELVVIRIDDAEQWP
jgi:hypothetical protein